MAIVLQDGGGLDMLSAIWGSSTLTHSSMVFLYTNTLTVTDTLVPYTAWGGSAVANAANIVQAVDRTTFATGAGVKAVYKGAIASNILLTNPAATLTNRGVSGFWTITNPDQTDGGHGLISTVTGVPQAAWTDYTFVFTGYLISSEGDQAGSSGGTTNVKILGYGIVNPSKFTWASGATPKQGFTIATGGLMWVENFLPTLDFTPRNDGDTLTLGLRFKLGNVTAGTSPI